MNETRTYSAAETATILGLSKNALIDHARAGTLHPPIKYVAAGRAIRFVKIDVDRATGENAA